MKAYINFFDLTSSWKKAVLEQLDQKEVLASSHLSLEKDSDVLGCQQVLLPDCPDTGIEQKCQDNIDLDEKELHICCPDDFSTQLSDEEVLATYLRIGL